MKFVTGSFEAEERKEAILTTPNIMTGARAAGGVALGVLLARGGIDPTAAAGTAMALAATDAEGTVINAAKRFPRVRDGLRIWPSKLGRVTDVVADKVFVLSTLGGGMAGGIVPNSSGLAIIGTEVATSLATMYTTKKSGKEPTVSSIGKIGMVARITAIGGYFSAAAISNESTAHVMENVGHGATIAAVALGVLSCRDVLRQSTSSVAPLVDR